MTTGPDILQRYNMSVRPILMAPMRRDISTGQALTVMEDVAGKELPQGYGFEWTSIAYQEKEAGAPRPIFGMAMLFVFLVLPAQYESWAVPFSVLLGLPVGVFVAFLGVSLVGLENNVYVQIGIVTLIGLRRQERHPHRRVCEGVSREEGHEPRSRSRGRRETSLPADHDDSVGLHSWCRTASNRERRRRGSARQHRHSGVCRHVVASTVGLFFIPMLYVLIQRGAYLVTGNKTASQGVVQAEPELKEAHA